MRVRVRAVSPSQSCNTKKTPRSLLVVLHATAVLVLSSLAHGADAARMTIPVDSPAFVFSPGNWVGDEGRGGKLYRQTWNPGAYVRVTWESTETDVVPTLLLDTSTYDGKVAVPQLACNLDGTWTGSVPCGKEIPISGAQPTGKHVLTVYLKTSVQKSRWGTEGKSGTNVVRVTGLSVAAGSKPGVDAPQRRWALIVGDSITEGCGVTDLEGYSHLLGQAFQSQGYEYAVSACGWSGWINRGDDPPGDVPGYYVVKNSVDGAGGEYLDAMSRWNRIDVNHSLLDAQGHLSAYGQTGQEPSVITINYGTNDALWHSNPSDVQASIAQCLAALRKAAPEAHIFLIIPFGQYMADDIHRTARAYQAAHPDEKRLSIIDLGPDAARALTAPSKGYWGGLHPNARAHATFAARIIAQVMSTLGASTLPQR